MTGYGETKADALDTGYMRVSRSLADDRFPACVKLVAGFRWERPSDLRVAAGLLGDAADWLERTLAEGQGSLFEDGVVEATDG